MCTSIVEQCVIDAMATNSDERRVLYIAHVSQTFSNFIGLAIRGGYRDSFEGGGIYIGGASKTNFIRCEIASNLAGFGGGIYVHGTAPFVNLHATVFLDNTANFGADIFGYSGEISVYGCAFLPPVSSTNIYSSGATLTFKGSACDAGEAGFASSYVPTLTGSVIGTPASYPPPPTSCRNCTAGLYSTPFAEQCSPCQAGTFTNDNGTATCFNCPKGTYTFSSGAVACTHCESGKSSITEGADTPLACVNCEPGTYSTPASISCTTCTPGKYSNVLKSNCNDCESGKFSAINADKCTACPIGKSGPSSSSSCSCTPPFATLPDESCACAAGYTFDGSSCERCGNGYFKTTTSNNPCTTCNVALEHSLSTRSGDLPTSPSACICGSGEVQVNDACEPCPEGGLCEELGLTLEAMSLLPSYWRTSNSSADVLHCDNEAACTPPTNSTDVCALNHVGPLCEMCAKGYALAAGTCVSCKGGEAGGFALAVMALFVLGAMGWCVYSIKDRDETKEVVGAGGLFVKRFKLPAKLLLQVSLFIFHFVRPSLAPFSPCVCAVLPGY